LTDLDLVYWVTHYFDGTEHGVAWDDPTLAVPWGSRTRSSPTATPRPRLFDWKEVARPLTR
jgi:dTDP-4-dehydrorhamnose 3,5-epimerase-like enzyme